MGVPRADSPADAKRKGYRPAGSGLSCCPSSRRTISVIFPTWKGLVGQPPLRC